MLIIMSGSAGVGKNTLINRLLSEYNNLALMPTVTTRDMRAGETQGFPYVFVDRAEFEGMLERGEMVEYCPIHGNLYGTNRRILEEAQRGGRVLIKDIDVEGTLKLKSLLPDVVAVYLKPKSREQLVERLVGRGEKQIELRLRRYDYEEEMSVNYDYVLVNDDIEETLSTLREILERETALHGKTLVCP